MAIEAARSLAGTSQAISAYRCSNVNFPAGLRIPENTDSVEAQVVFNPVQQSGGGLPDQCRVHDFQIFAYFGEAWHELCYGTIEIEVSKDFDGVSETNPVDSGEKSNKRWENVNSKEFYDTINEHGMSFGPAFQGLQEVRVSERQATAQIELDRWHNNLNENSTYPHTPHVIHPTDLDVIFQSSIASISQGGRLPIPVLIPTKIRSLWISNELLTRGSRNVLDIHNQIDTEAYREADFSIAVHDKHRGKAQVRVEGLSLTFVKDAKWMERADEEARRTCWSLVWRPDPSLLTKEELASLCSSGQDNGHLAVATFVELFAHQDPLADIIEAEDITLETSRSIRDRLMTYGLDTDNYGLPLFRRYTITRSDDTDESNDHDGPFSDRVDRKAIETDGNNEEEFIDGLYDLLICHNHNYTLDRSQKSLLSLLKPHGKILCLNSFEILTKTDLDSPTHAEPNTLSSPKTNDTANCTTVSDSTIVILISPESELQRDVADLIQTRLSAGQVTSSTILLFDSINEKQYMGSHYISLLELDTSFFSDLKDEQWSIFKSILSTAKSFLWVTKGQTPDKDLVSGLGRVIRSEYLDLRFVELALETSTSIDRTGSHIASVFLKTLHTADDVIDFDSEYREQDGRLCIGRIREATNVNATIRSMVSPSRPKQQQFGADPQRALSLSIASPGLLNSLHFEDDPDYDLALGPTEVEIEVRATGMNFKDILIAMGQISGNRLGFECAGIVRRAGSESGFEPGQRVTCCTLSGAYKTFVRADASWVFDLPDHVPFTGAAGIPLVFATAYYSLVEVSRLSEGETVLIHSGAGGVGQAAIQIAQRLKARIFTTVGTAEKRQLLQDLYQIPESHIFNSRDTNFAQQVKTHCPSGVDVVLNSLRGELQEASWKCIAPLGRFVDVGKADFESSRKGLNMKPFLSNVSFSSVDLSVVMRNAKPTMARIMSALKSYLTDTSTPITSPQPLQVYQVGNFQDAFRQMASGKSSGKIVVDMNTADEVPVCSDQSKVVR
jgi:NADPH:quinone reductase-like Zn-dependent oxidoreductase